MAPKVWTAMAMPTCALPTTVHTTGPESRQWTAGEKAIPWPRIWSPVNYASFGLYMKTASESDWTLYKDLPIINHRGIMFGERIPPTLIREVNGERVEHQMVELNCNTMGCEWCTTGRGGWRFPCVGPWTKDAMMADPLEFRTKFPPKSKAQREQCPAQADHQAMTIAVSEDTLELTSNSPVTACGTGSRQLD